MLAVMFVSHGLTTWYTLTHISRRTFQAAYIIAIIVGLGAGEVAFGRWGSAGLADH